MSAQCSRRDRRRKVGELSVAVASVHFFNQNDATLRTWGA